jgi:hypothetical protein
MMVHTVRHSRRVCSLKRDGACRIVTVRSHGRRVCLIKETPPRARGFSYSGAMTCGP